MDLLNELYTQPYSVIIFARNVLCQSDRTQLRGMNPVDSSTLASTKDPVKYTYLPKLESVVYNEVKPIIISRARLTACLVCPRPSRDQMTITSVLP